MQPQSSIKSHPHSLSELSGFRVMEWLFWLRNLMILIQLAGVGIAISFLGMPLPLVPLSLAPTALLLFNLLVYWRLERGSRATEFEISLHLLFDMLVFTWLLYWTGGSINPFVSAYLVPVAAAAAFGALRYAVGLGLVAVAAYSGLMLWYVPLPPVDARFGGDFSLHIFGMWLSFLLSAAIVIIFIYSLARLTRQREIALKQAEQASINSEHLVALGALAAGAAHELATPLSNIAMLVAEIEASEGSPGEVELSVAAIRQQLGLCQSQIGILRNQANRAQHPEAMRGAASDFVTEVLERFRAMRSDIVVSIDAQPLAGQLSYDPSLSQTLLNLLNNAADASVANGENRIEIAYRIQNGVLLIYIEDHGQGFNEAQLAQVGAVQFSSKHEGPGIGLVLARANLARIGARLQLANRADGGVRTVVRIPVEEKN